MARKPNWDEPVLPLFDQPEAPVVKELSAKDVDDRDVKVGWRRYGSPVTMLCARCLNEYHRDERPGVNNASYIRTFQGVEVPLCYRHSTEQRHLDQLGPIGPARV